MKIYSYRGKKNLSGDKIREARLKQRLSQSDYELKIFAKVLHVNVEWLLEETEE